MLTLAFTGSRADPVLLTAAYPIYLGLLLVVAFALLFSTLTSSTLAAVLTVGVVVVGRFADVIRGMGEVLPGVPPLLAQTLFTLVPNFANFDFKTRAAYGEAVPAAVLGWVTLYAAAWTVVVLGLGLARFRSRDFQ
jgi:ABC-type transport system involved in multi-copper enzyme maturation permease subunit